MAWNHAVDGCVSDFKERMNKLSPREKQICEVLKQKPGLTVKGIGHEVGVSYGTTKNYLKRVYQKLEVGSRPELIANLCKEK